MGRAYDTFLEKLRTGGFKVEMHGRDRARAQCPAHQGTDTNLSIAVGDQGLLVSCKSYDCPPADIMSAVGLGLGDMFDNGRDQRWTFPDGRTIVRSNTRDGKRIIQQNVPKDAPSLPLLRHPMSEPLESPSGHVTLVEGEKSVHAALMLGAKCVTTWPQGAQQAENADLTPLHGRDVVLIADNDEQGMKAMATIRRRLEPFANVLGVWTAPGELGCKRGVDDIWTEGGTLADLVGANHLLPSVEGEHDDEPKAVLTWLGGIETESVSFLWDGIIPAGCLSILAGQGGVAKSTFSLWLAGQLTKGTLPGVHFGEPQKVLMVSHEDSLSSVVKPRAIANGADTAMIAQLGVHSKEVGATLVPRFPEDLDVLRQAIDQSGAKVVIIDPIASTITGDTDKVAEVRAALDPLNALGHELGVSFIAIAHLKKGGGAGAHLLSGSHAYRDACRCLILFARDKESNRTHFTVDKSNYGESGHSYGFGVQVTDLLVDDGSYTKVGVVHDIGSETVSAEELINAAQNVGERRRKDKVTPQQIADYMSTLGGRVVTPSQIAEVFDGANEGLVIKLLRDLAGRGVVEQVEMGLWRQRFPEGYAPEPEFTPGACPGCGGALPCEKEHHTQWEQDRLRAAARQEGAT